MKKMKRSFLALLLAFTMVLGSGVQSVAASTETNVTAVTQEDQTLLNEPEQEEQNGVQETEGGVSVQSSTAVPEARAVAVTGQPQDGATVGQPFASGTAGSTYFRIPSLITLQDGSLLAAADARWNDMSDGGGLDTLVSKSTDNGVTWKYTFANYFGDNGNVYNSESSAFIDPAMVQDDDGTIYLLVDVFPGGVSNLNDCNEGTGYVSVQGTQRLALSTDGSNYNFYVGDFADGYADICRINDNASTGYAVNENYDLFSRLEDGRYIALNDNVFFSGAIYRVFPTSYLWLVTSEDGTDWSAPRILNAQVKNSSETFYGVGPGRGLVTSSGRIIFPCYRHSGSFIPQERTSFIYSDDHGQTWRRTEDLSQTSSETAVTEADGRLYAFTRTGSSALSDRSALTYYTSSDNGTSWSGRMDASIDTWTACQMSAITYTEKIDGRTAIILSAPSGSERTNGRIYVGLVQGDGSLDWAYSCEVNTGSFEYSCLTEQADGSIGILYEPGAGSITYENISIDDVAPGAQIGNTIRQTIDLYLGDKETETVTVDGHVSPIVADGSIVSVTARETDDGNIKERTELTFTAENEGTTTVTAGDYVFTVNVRSTPRGDFSNIGDLTFVSNTGNSQYSFGKTVSHLILTPGKQYDLNLAGAEGYAVTWSSGNRNVAAVDSNGVVTASQWGDTVVTAEVRNADGVIVGRHTATVSVLEIEPMASWIYYPSRDVEIYIDQVQDSRLYYRQNDEDNFNEVYADTVIYIESTGAWAMTFFGAPSDDSYALTYLSAANNQDQNQWYAIEDTDSMEATTFYQNCSNLRSRDLYSEAEVIQMLQRAKALGADGGFWFTRDKLVPGDPCRAVVNVVSERLPSVEKSVTSVIHNNVETPYGEGVQICPGDMIVYDIAVHRYATEYGLTYNNVSLTEELDGAAFTSGGVVQDITGDLATDPSEEKIFHYEARYSVKESDGDTMVTNRVRLSYGYQLQYGWGGMEAETDAEVKTAVQSFVPDDYVIDYGLPIRVDFTGKVLHDFTEGTATFGNVTIENGKTIIYTPERVLTEADTVYLTNTEGVGYSFRVYPATSVYYEEGFADYSEGWSGYKRATDEQTVSAVNDGTSDLYGYDVLYSESDSDSNESLAESSTKNASAEFIFNGTGLDIYGRTDAESGSMSMWLYKGTGPDRTLQKLGYVDTANNWLKGNDGSYYNTPIFTYRDLTPGTYTVKIVVEQGDVSLDGFRVYGTQDDAYETIYQGDREDNPQIWKLRDIVIAGSTYDPEVINDWYIYGNEIIDAVYDKTAASGAVILQEGDTITADADMINNGPKHEIYLQKGQTIAVGLNTASYEKVAVGMRSLNGGTVQFEQNGEPAEISSTVDMYYEIIPKDGAIVITNKGDAVLALTTIKVTGLSEEISLSSVFTMDTDTMAYALQCIAGNDAPAAAAEATLTVEVMDYKGQSVAETVLTAAGTKGKTCTFTASDIQAAAEDVLPDSYVLTGGASDTDVVYGENGSCQIQAGKTAVLNVTYRNWLGRTVGTAQIVSPGQTSGWNSYLFTWNDVRKQVPDGYVLLNLLTLKNVSYGSEGSIKVTVF